MALVVIHLPPRPRLHPARAQTPATQAQESVAELEFIHSADGTTLTERGTTAPALLPGLRSGATQVVAVLGEAALSWHRVTLPRAPAARLRLALTGLLEDELLDEPQALHLALEPGARAGAPCWVAVADRPWLAEQLAALEAAGIEVDRIVPVAPPQSPGHAHLESQDESIDAYAQTTIAGLSLSMTWAHADGVLQLPLSGTVAPELMPQPLPEGTRVTATPTAALEAERWFGEQVPILSTAERWLEATRSDWNLRQFELAPHHRGAAALRTAWQDFRSPAWRAARWGLAALVALQLVGLNAWAWHQQRELRATREAMTNLLRSAHPQVRAILDAPIQMQRETDALRTAAGRPGPADLERLLQAAASAWPADEPVQSLRFEPGQLSLAPTRLQPPQLEGVAQTLHSAGWRAEVAGNDLLLRPAPAAGATP